MWNITELTPGSGHTIEAPHIEAPVRPFYVRWDSPLMPSAQPGCVWAPCKRWAKVMSSTPGGALEIARYHHFMGKNHELLLRHEWPED